MATSVQDFLKQNPNYIGVANTSRQTPKKKKGKGGTATSLISEGGAAGGVLAGGATGAALGSVVPGLGTLVGGIIGAGIGGFAGGTAGRGVENKVRDDQNFFGKGGSAKVALQEGLLAGALGAIPLGGVGKVVRGGQTALATQGAKRGLTGKIADSGTRMASRSAGIGAGEKIGGQELTTPVSRNLYAWGRAQGMPVGHPEKINTWAVGKQQEIGERLANEVAKTNTRIKPTTIAQDFRTAFEKNAALRADPAAQRTAANIERSIKKIRTNKGVIEGRRNFQDFVNYTKVGGKDPSSEQVYKLAVDITDKHIGKISPTVKVINREYSNASKIAQGSTKQAQRQTRMSEQAGGGVISKVLTGDTAQTGKSVVGGTLARLGGNPAAAPKDLIGAILSKGTGVREFAKQGIGQNVARAMAPSTVGLTPYTETEPEDQTLYGELAVAPESGGGYAQQATPPMGLEDALIQAQSILGDSQTPATYLSYAKAIMSANKPNANQQKTSMALTNARNVVDELTQAYQTVGGAQGAGTGTARNLAGKVRLDQNARNYNDLRQAFLSRIARAFGEVGTLNEGDINRALGAIPDLADNQQTAARKLDILYSLLAKAEQNNSGGMPIDLEDQLSQLQGVY